MRRLFAVTAIATVLVGAPISLTGCPPDDPTPPVACTLAFLGDKSKPVQLEITARDVAGHSAPVKDGGDVAVVFPPQGGRVIFVGARVTNVDPCGAKLSGALRDLATGQVRVDIRTVNLVPTSDGFGGTLDVDISTFSNIPVCPNQWASDDVFDKPYELEVTVTDKTGRRGTQKVKVIPRCAEPDRATECRCICRKGYILGSACTPEVDAGADAAPDAAPDAASDADEGG